jgi:putative FmdB family regulatory protein
MARYEYRCRTCHEVYEERRSMADADAPATCPDGHVGAVRVFAVFATTGRGERSSAVAGERAPMPGGCGPGCACYPG